MATFLFDEIIFGPVQSRRLGVSLGINLLPTDSKLCSFDCIYCECGWNPDPRKVKAKLPSRERVAEELEKKLYEMAVEGKLPDVITFAGNGEPTLHPDFKNIVNDVIELRNEYFEDSKIAVLTNSTTLDESDIVTALKKVDYRLIKLDSAIQESLELINRPDHNYDLKKLKKQLKVFNNKFIIQTMFLKGEFEGNFVDNTTEKEIKAYLEFLKEVNPRMVMIYTIDRQTPYDNLQKTSPEGLNGIAKKINDLGFEVDVSE